MRGNFGCRSIRVVRSRRESHTAIRRSVQCSDRVWDRLGTDVDNTVEIKDVGGILHTASLAKPLQRADLDLVPARESTRTPPEPTMKRPFEFDLRRIVDSQHFSAQRCR